MLIKKNNKLGPSRCIVYTIYNNGLTAHAVYVILDVPLF